MDENNMNLQLDLSTLSKTTVDFANSSRTRSGSTELYFSSFVAKIYNLLIDKTNL